MRKTQPKPQKKDHSPFAIEPLESRQLLSAAVIDLLIAYTTAAKTAAGGASAIQSQINKAVADANQVLSNSLIDLTLRLVHSEEVSYSESGSLATDLGRLQDPADGQLDTIAAMRDAWGADLVSLFVASGNSAGISYIMDDPASETNADYAFSVIRQDSSFHDNCCLE